MKHCPKCGHPLNSDHVHRTYEEHDACRNKKAPRPLPCGYPTYAGEGNIDFCGLPCGHDDGIHQQRGINDGPRNSIIRNGYSF